MEELDNDKKVNKHTVDAAQEILDEMLASLQKKDYEKLKELSHQYVLSYPNVLTGWSYLSLATFELKEYKKCIEHSYKLFDLEHDGARRNSQKIYLNIANCYYHLNEKSEALNVLIESFFNDRSVHNLTQQPEALFFLTCFILNDLKPDNGEVYPIKDFKDQTNSKNVQFLVKLNTRRIVHKDPDVIKIIKEMQNNYENKEILKKFINKVDQLI
tara:strand:- start:590 stop:1231 length:642 start_codon:yes stop_codon:yes gene_type:complete